MTSKRHALVAVVAVVAVIVAAGCAGGTQADNASTTESNAVEVEWFVGLGTGAQPEQFAAQEAVVDDFNAAHENVELTITFVDPDDAHTVLRERIDAGDPPDVVGPVGIQGANRFAGEFLDLRPFLAELEVDQYDPVQLEIWREGTKVTALPFGVFPSAIFYNRELFDRAGIAYPPAYFGETYEGLPWDIEALTRVATRLTLDAQGRHADEPGFDPERVVQFGFHHQWIEDVRAHGSFFGAGSLVADDGSAQIPDAWRDEWRWYRDAMFTSGISPDADEANSTFLDDRNAFATGHVAMAFTHLWYASSIVDDEDRPLDFWDLAVVPSHEGTATAKIHADTFRVLATTPHPEAAIEVLRFLQGAGSADLLRAYSSFPARLDQRDEFLEDLANRFPSVESWSVVEESLTRPDIPSHEALLPGMPRSQELLDDFGERLRSDPDLDLESAIEALVDDLTTAFAAS
ncbi:ABC transporter substrate-binding protein [Actinospongicola halichondriae]|uniref:ABC transporter substrate-binding protein n=1 Tax=Actinospongicola halichondriae TaxID=3236844 RepID=UPI003D5C3BF7